MEGSVLLTVIYFIIGASVGSFLNVVADRLPNGESLVRPRSACPSCKHALSNSDLFPIVSYLWLRGKCRYCGAAIPVRILAVEVITGLLFAGVFVRFGSGPDSVLMAAAASLLVVVAIIDLEHELILNRIVFPSAIVLLFLSPFWSELGLSRTFLDSSGMIGSLANSLSAGAAGFFIFMSIKLVYPPGMGFGDVKYAGLLGLLLGLQGVLIALYGAVLSGGLLAILLLVLRKKGRKDHIPFGVFMSLGGVAVLLAEKNIVSGYKSLIDAVRGL